jgi:hypothetical protein
VTGIRIRIRFRGSGASLLTILSSTKMSSAAVSVFLVDVEKRSAEIERVSADSKITLWSPTFELIHVFLQG